mgnify:CR=1 FL=1
MAKIEVTSEVTGIVWKVQAKVGDVLAEEDVIMILESMKMEIAILAPEAGRVKKQLLREGARVSAGQSLLILEALS